MSENLEVNQFAERALNNLSTMIKDTSKKPDGTPRDLSEEMAVGVLTAQGNLAIAAALMVVAQSIGRRS